MRSVILKKKKWLSEFDNKYSLQREPLSGMKMTKNWQNASQSTD